MLIIGASGGVGTFAVQLAKHFDAHVTGVCSTAKTELVRSLGADVVIDYTREDFADRPERYDLILDTAGRRSLSRLRRALTARGTLVIVGGEGGGRLTGGFERHCVPQPCHGCEPATASYVAKERPQEPRDAPATDRGRTGHPGRRPHLFARRGRRRDPVRPRWPRPRQGRREGRLIEIADNTAVMRDLRPDQRGVTAGLLNLSRNLGLITGASVLGVVFAAAATTDITTASAGAVATGMHVTFALAAVLTLVALAAAIGTYRRPPRMLSRLESTAHSDVARDVRPASG